MAELIGDDGETVSLQSIMAGTVASLMPASSPSSPSSPSPTASTFGMSGGESLLSNAAIHRIEPGEFDGKGFDLADQEPVAEAFDSSKTIAVDQTVVINPDEDLNRVFDSDRFDEPTVDLAVSDQNDEVESFDEYEDEDEAEYEPTDDAEYQEDLEFRADPDEVDSGVGAYDDSENESQPTPIQGPVAPRPLSATVARDFGAVPVALRPRTKKKGSPIRTTLGIVAGGLLAIPAAGGVLTLLGQKPDWGFYPFLGTETKTVAGDPMQLPDRQLNWTKADENTEDGWPLDDFNVPGNDPNLLAEDEVPSPADSFANEAIPSPTFDMPQESTDPSTPPTASVTPNNTTVETAETSDVNVNLPLLTDDAAVSRPPSVTLDPVNENGPSKIVIDPVIQMPGDSASPESLPGDLPSPLTMPAEVVSPALAESSTSDIEKVNSTSPSSTNSPEELAMGKTDSLPASEEIREPAPESVKEPAVSFAPPASPLLVEAVEQAKTALRKVTEFPKDGDAGSLKANKALLYTSISNVANVPQAVSQPETTEMLDQVVASGLMNEMTAVALNWLKYSKRTHDGLFAIGQAVEENGEWVLKIDNAKGPTVVQLQRFDISGIASGDRAVVLAKIIDSSPPAIIRVVYMKKQETN